MLTYSKLGNNGRLGNQLFQIASTIGLACHYGTNYSFPKWNYSKYFKNHLPTIEQGGIEINEPHFHYSSNIIPFTNNFIKNNIIDLNGYFQSEFYFAECKDLIKHHFTFKEDLITQVRNYYDDNEVFDKPVIAISIRRGDYVNNENYLQLPITFYFKALLDNFGGYENVIDNYNIIIFSDDIPNCRVHFGALHNVYFSENNSDIEDLCLMSQCNHFILSNSTFSWWGAWLGEKEDSIVIRPDGLFDGKLKIKNDEKDFYPNRWIVQIGNKLDLSDVTFCIPIKIDSNDRIENLDLCVKHIKKHFNTEIFIMEETSNPIYIHMRKDLDISKLVKFEVCNNGVFHRTKMLNDMFKKSNTSFVANWDADVLISPISIWLAVNLLRKGETMVFPYKWAFARIPREPYYKKILWTLDIGVVGDNMFNGMLTSDAISVGGAVLMNRENYLSIGGENENFISFGAEDVERVIRNDKVSLKHKRVNGTLYHLQHWVGIDSSPRNPYFQNNKDEYEKVKNMNFEELKNYIKTWKWI